MLPIDYYDYGECPEVECVDCGESVYVTSAEYDRASESWICDDCLYPPDDSDDEDEDWEDTDDVPAKWYGGEDEELAAG
jgi:hypothetical protein